MESKTARSIRLGVESPLQAIRRLLVEDVGMQEHLEVMRDGELGSLLRLQFVETLENQVAMSCPTKAKVMAAAWAAGTAESVCFLDELLFDRNDVNWVGIGEIHRMVKILDCPRATRQLNVRIRMLQAKEVAQKGNATKLRNRINKCMAKVHELEVDHYVGGRGLNGSLAKRVRRWFKTLPASNLEFFLLNFPTKPWKLVMDLVHSNPADFSLPYFQKCCFGMEAPEDSLVYQANHLTAATLPAMIEQYPFLGQSYSFLRRRFKASAELARYGEPYLTIEAKEAIARVAPIEDLLWFYDELRGGDVEDIVYHRLEEDQALEAVRGRSNYGKLMERILHFRSSGVRFSNLLIRFAESRLEEVMREVQCPVGVKSAVFGDASASMQTAIEVSTIIGSLLSACLQAELSFFKNTVVMPPVQPRTASQVLDVAETIRASHCTCPAACLWPYLKEEKHVDFVVVVTDEVENREVEGMDFATMFARYRHKVNPRAQLFFVSFLPKAALKGKMQIRCDETEIDYKRFLLDLSTPDLTKLDSLMGTLSLQLKSIEMSE